MNKYPVYKPSNIPWIGDVPEHWDVVGNRRIFFERKEYNTDEHAELLSVSQYTGVTKKKDATVKTGMHDADSINGYRIVREGDFVMNYMLAWNGSMGISRYNGVTSPAYAVFHIKEDVNKWYLHYLLRLPFMNQYFEAYSTGMVKSRLRLYPDTFKSLYSFLPPLSEQTQIVRYLDWQVSRINKLISAKKKQIALLKEQKQGVINKTIYTDLNPAKSSFLFVKLGRLVSFINGFAFDSGNFSNDGEIPVIRIGDIQDDKLDYNSCIKVKSDESLLPFCVKNRERYCYRNEWSNNGENCFFKIN
ncbi:Type I restriction modification DNA specificity domain protein [Bacteroidales bacterium Barb6]|nr:Type I restriction modification DNA specificity domain protein [Bacteroidales bacterium Barb6]